MAAQSRWRRGGRISQGGGRAYAQAWRCEREPCLRRLLTRSLPFGSVLWENKRGVLKTVGSSMKVRGSGSHGGLWSKAVRADFCCGKVIAAPGLVMIVAFSPLCLTFCISTTAIVRIHENSTLEVLWEYQRGQPLFLLMLVFETKTSSPWSTQSLPCVLGKVTPLSESDPPGLAIHLPHRGL